MTTEITKSTFSMDGKPCFEIKQAVVTSVGDVRSGISEKTGQEWKMQTLNIEIRMGEGVRSDYMRLTIPSRLVDEVMGYKLKQGDVITTQVSFSIIGSRFLQNEARVLSLKKDN